MLHVHVNLMCKDYVQLLCVNVVCCIETIMFLEVIVIPRYNNDCDHTMGPWRQTTVFSNYNDYSNNAQ